MNQRTLQSTPETMRNLAYCSYCDSTINTDLGSYCPQCGNLHAPFPTDVAETENADVAEAINFLNQVRPYG